MLYLNIQPGDKVLIGEGEDQIIISFETLTGKTAKLGANAPREIPIYTIFADTAKQFKNRRKAGEANEN